MQHKSNGGKRGPHQSNAHDEHEAEQMPHRLIVDLLNFEITYKYSRPSDHLTKDSHKSAHQVSQQSES